MKTLQERITEDKVRATVTYGYSGPTVMENAENMNPWTVILKMGKRQMTTPFFTGYGISGEPTAEEVLTCLLYDAATYETSDCFEDWDSELGFDADSRKDERIFHAVERQVEKLKRFLGYKYQEYLWDTEAL